MLFKQLTLPHVDTGLVPDDLDIVVPTHPEIPDVDEKYIHSLAFIPWSDKYLARVPTGYQNFYKSILPMLNARTTDVHSALSVSFIDELIAISKQDVNRHILIIAFLLHDIGWAKLTPAQIALSLNCSAFTYTEEALEPKRLHASVGSEIAASVLKNNTDMYLSDEDKKYIVKLVRFHDQIDPWPEKPEPIEYLLLGDADRLWSYTHENFWLDTIRKNTMPREYLDNITSSIDGYFLTEAGKTIARRQVTVLLNEVNELEKTSNYE